MLKYKIGVFFLFILMIFELSFVKANNRNLPLLGKVIYLDPGHGRYSYAKTNKNIMLGLK